MPRKKGARNKPMENFENAETGGSMKLSGENPAVIESGSSPESGENPAESYSEERNQKVNASNQTRSLRSNHQELNPAHSPEKVPKAAAIWEPASILTVTGKDPNFDYCFVVNTPEAIYKAIEEGKEVDQDPNCCANMLRKEDPSGQWSNVKIRGDLILMRMPLEVKKARDQYFKDRIVNSTAVVKQIAQDYRSGGGKGSISGEIKREVVTEKI